MKEWIKRLKRGVISSEFEEDCLKLIAEIERLERNLQDWSNEVDRIWFRDRKEMMKLRAVVEAAEAVDWERVKESVFTHIAVNGYGGYDHWSCLVPRIEKLQQALAKVKEKE